MNDTENRFIRLLICLFVSLLLLPPLLLLSPLLVDPPLPALYPLIPPPLHFLPLPPLLPLDDSLRLLSLDLLELDETFCGEALDVRECVLQSFRHFEHLCILWDWYCFYLLFGVLDGLHGLIV